MMSRALCSVAIMDSAVDFLLSGDPAIRWQTLRDLTEADSDEVARERARVASEGWGAQLLAAQTDDGRWDGGVYRPGWVPEHLPMFDAWSATHFCLQQLVDLGVDPHDPRVRAAIDLVEAHVRWEHDDEPYFDGETEPCINGVALRAAVYFDRGGEPIIDTLLAGQLPDGGWNCWDDDGTSVASLHSTICALEGLRDAYDAGIDDGRLAEALRRGEEVLLQRRLLFRRTDGTVIDPRFTMTSYPVRWFYDSLRALEYFRLADRPDPRLSEAIELLRAKQNKGGLFRNENRHEGPVLFELTGETEGAVSRWVTLRARRVLRWWDAAH